MKTIKEEALEHIRCEETLEELFESGIKFAQRWIPIEEELPPIGVEVVVKERFNEHDIYVFNSTKDRLTKCQDNCITHWRPIEFK